MVNNIRNILGVVLLLIVTAGAAAADRLNILFIVSDDHGWGDLPSNWDRTEVRLPTLDALAAKGVRPAARRLVGTDKRALRAIGLGGGRRHEWHLRAARLRTARPQVPL